jgi:hypothetical protein
MELESIKSLSYEFFNKLLIEIEDINIEEEDKDIVNIKVKTPDSSLVI